MPTPKRTERTAARRRWRAPIFAVLGAPAIACGDPHRPEFSPEGPAADTVPPLVAVVAPAESVFAAGEVIAIRIEVRDDVRVRAVGASVSGALNFGWPSVFPDDTLALVEYSIATGSLIAGDLTFLAVARDTADNRGSAVRRFYVR